MSRRFHKKRDGWLMLDDDGARFLTWWESVLYVLFCKEPPK